MSVTRKSAHTTVRESVRDALFFDPTPEQQNVILVDAATLREAEKLIESCEHCHPNDADIPFDLDSRPSYRLRSECDGLRSGRAG
jgi:hypothetical protein